MVTSRMICPQAVQRGGSCAVGSRSDAIAVTIHSRCKWSSHPGRSWRRCLCTSELSARFVSRAGGGRATAVEKRLHRKGWSVSGPIGEHYPLPFDYEPRRHPVQSQGTYSIKERYRMSLDYVAPSLMLPRAFDTPAMASPWRGLSVPTSNADEHRAKREMREHAERTRHRFSSDA